jgi:molybdopterin-containing oxidoreductase family iron-sulfur binding subunit
MENEFPSLAAELNSPTTRRGFLKRMGGTFALAGIIGWRWPQEKILPFARRPEGRTPGVPRNSRPQWNGSAARRPCS